MLSGCLARDPVVTTITRPAGNWQIEKPIDRITGAPIASAILVTHQVSTSNIVFAPPAQMQLTCFKGGPAVGFEFPFKIGSTRTTSFGYRFDDKPGHEINAQFMSNYRTAMIEAPADVAQFVDELSTSKTLYIRIRSFSGAGRTTAEFSLQGASAAIKAAYLTCPVQNPKMAQAPAAGKKTGAR